MAVEAFGSAEELDFDRLEGRWRLEYTTARDVLPLVAPQRLPAPLQVPGPEGCACTWLRMHGCRGRHCLGAPGGGLSPKQPTNQPPLRAGPQVGRIWQQFSSVEEGRVLNVIEALLPPQLPLAEGAGLTLLVEAGWEVHSARNIALSFRWVVLRRDGAAGMGRQAGPVCWEAWLSAVRRGAGGRAAPSMHACMCTRAPPQPTPCTGRLASKTSPSVPACKTC